MGDHHPIMPFAVRTVSRSPGKLAVKVRLKLSAAIFTFVLDLSELVATS